MSDEVRIEVLLEDSLVSEIDRLAQRTGTSRMVLIREACQRLVDSRASVDRMDAVYEDGYRRFPEDPLTGEAQVAIVGNVLSAQPGTGVGV